MKSERIDVPYLLEKIARLQQETARLQMRCSAWSRLASVRGQAIAHILSALKCEEAAVLAELAPHAATNQTATPQEPT